MRSTDKFIKHLKRQNPFREALSWFKADDVIKGQPYIEEEDGVLTLHFDEMSVQSEMRLDAPDELVMSYTRALMSFMLFVPNPEQIPGKILLSQSAAERHSGAGNQPCSDRAAPGICHSA
jgi:hypothetical protein